MLYSGEARTQQNRLSLDRISTKVNRAWVDQEYQAINRNRQLPDHPKPEDLQIYISHLEEANQKLHL